MEIAEELFQQQAGTKKKNIVHIYFNCDRLRSQVKSKPVNQHKDDRKNAWQVIRIMIYRTKQDI